MPAGPSPPRRSWSRRRAWRWARPCGWPSGQPTATVNLGEHLGKYTKADGTVDFDKLPDPWPAGGVSYSKDELKATLDKIGAPVTREKYLQVQRHNWKTYYIPPSIFVVVWVLVFIFLGKEPVAAAPEPAKT